MILVAGIHDSDLDRVKVLLEDYTFPTDQHVIDREFAAGGLTVPEWAKAIRSIADEQTEPFGFGSALSAGFFSGYVSLFPTAEIIVVRSDPLAAIAGMELPDGHDRWSAVRGALMGHESIERVMHSVPHALIDMQQDPTDEQIRALMGQLERAA